MHNILNFFGTFIQILVFKTHVNVSRALALSTATSDHKTRRRNVCTMQLKELYMFKVLL